MTITCPTCQKPHALFYTVHKGGKKTLNYLCNRIERYEPSDVLDNNGKTQVVMRYATAIQEAEFKPDLPIPEKWSPGYAKEQQDKQQNQLPIMWAKPKVAE